MVILVTGGAGYIGSHTCVALLEAGYDVIVADNFSNSKPEALKRVTAITGKNMKIYHVDLLDVKKLATIFSENKIDAVVHLAGLKAVGESTLLPLRYYQNNLAGTANLCEVMKRNGVKRFIFSSSATVYRTQEGIPIHEEMPLGAVNPYGRSKQMIEQILKDLAASDPEWDITILRYFNPIGAHESGLIGEDPTGVPNNLLPYIAQVAIGKRQQLQIFGNDYPTKDGTGIRDYIHVVDLAHGHVKALERLDSAAGVGIFNLGTGNGYSVLEVIQAFEKASGMSVAYTFVERRKGDAASSFADPTKANMTLGWRATKGIHDMCADTWHWQKNNPFGYESVAKSTIGSSG